MQSELGAAEMPPSELEANSPAVSSPKELEVADDSTGDRSLSTTSSPAHTDWQQRTSSTAAEKNLSEEQDQAFKLEHEEHLPESDFIPQRRTKHERPSSFDSLERERLDTDDVEAIPEEAKQADDVLEEYGPPEHELVGLEQSSSRNVTERETVESIRSRHGPFKGDDELTEAVVGLELAEHALVEQPECADHVDNVSREPLSDNPVLPSNTELNAGHATLHHRELEELDDLDDSQASWKPMSFRDVVKGRTSPSNTSSPPRARSRGILSNRSSRSGSVHSFRAHQGSPSPSVVAYGSPLSQTSSRGGSPSLKETDARAMSDASLASGRSPQSSVVKTSPLDNLDRLLATQSPTPHASRSSSTRLPVRLGLLSFNEQEYDGTEYSNGLMNGDSSDRSKEKLSNATASGVRRHEDRTRKLETENMELRLKLQQYREMNASEQEITRVKWQVDRAERRIDELEQALERKNRTISELSQERDLLAARVRPEHEFENLQLTVSELQTAITELEAQSAAADEVERSTSSAMADLRELLPDLIPPNAIVGDLVTALKSLSAENNRLAEVEAELKVVSQLLLDAGRDGNGAARCVRLLIQEFTVLQQELRDTKEIVLRDRKKHSRDIDLLKESQRQQVDSLLLSENKLRQELAKSQAVQTTFEEKLKELGEVVENQHKIIGDTRAENYGIVRRFFSELIEVMGDEFQASVEAELQNVIDIAQRQGVSKLPLLTDLLLRYTRQIAEEAVRSYTAPAVDLKVRAMEQEVQSLEHMLAMKLDKNGADAILVAQNRDLRRALKLEQEKRKTDWNEYTKTIAAIR